MALHIGLVLGYTGLFLLTFFRGETWKADFTSQYTGAVLVWKGYGRYLYDPGLQTQYQRAILGGRYLAEGLLPYNHPPHLAILLAPLAVLPLERAYIIWTLLNVGIWTAFLWDVGRFAAPWGKRTRLLVVTTIAALPGVLLSFLLGTFSVWSTGILWGFYRALKKGSNIGAGLWLALGSIHPQAIVLPALMLIGARRWRSLGVLIAAGLLITVLSGLLLGWSVWPGFLEMLKQTAGVFDRFWVEPRTMVNLKGVLTVLLGEQHGILINAISALGFVAAGLLILRLWHRPWRPDAPEFDLRMGLTLLMGLFFSPHANPQDGLMIALPGLLLYAFLKARRYPTRIFEIAAFLFPLLWLVDAFFWRPNPIPIAAMVAIGILILLYLREGKNELPAA